MEIRDPIHGSIELSDAEVAILDTPQYQRLRAIKQLGFSEFSFPAATHNRYLHSIGVCHLAGRAFDHIFKRFQFSSPQVKERLRQCFRLATLLHDVGHGPLSHTTEEVMPPLKDLGVKVYDLRPKSAYTLGLAAPLDRKADHEDYTIKYITDSPLTETLRQQFSDIDPVHVVCLIDKTIPPPDDFFVDQGLNFRPILSQLVSSELDVDRMDYLERDSYFCGTNYGRLDLEWLLNNLTYHIEDGQLYLALNRRALYTFDDFMISRHHMHLMVYFHHKSIIYEEMLTRYLTSQDCTYFLPAQLDEYTRCTDYGLFEHLAGQENIWAKRIASRRPYRVVLELHNTEESERPRLVEKSLNDQGIDTIWASSSIRLSKYHAGAPQERVVQIYVVDQYDKWDKPTPIDRNTQIFKQYENARVIDRIYVAPEQFDLAKKIVESKRV